MWCRKHFWNSKANFLSASCKVRFDWTFLPHVIVCCTILYNILLAQSREDVKQLLQVLKQEGLHGEMVDEDNFAFEGPDIEGFACTARPWKECSAKSLPSYSLEPPVPRATGTRKESTHNLFFQYFSSYQTLHSVPFQNCVFIYWIWQTFCELLDCKASGPREVRLLQVAQPIPLWSRGD
jgi:hypothetical protein